MGLQLNLVKIASNKRHRIDGELFQSSKMNWAFVEANKLDTITIDERDYSRPFNFKQAIEWVKSNEDDINSKDAITSLNSMKNDSNLYLEWDY